MSHLHTGNGLYFPSWVFFFCVFIFLSQLAHLQLLTYHFQYISGMQGESTHSIISG